jgi:hypothetical protein
MSMTLNERNPNVDIIPIGTFVSASTAVVPGLYFRKHSRIKNVYFVDQVGIAKSSSNYQTVTLQDNSGSPVAYAAVATSAVAAVVNTPLAMTLSTPVGTDLNEADVPAGTQLNVSVVGTGTAVLTKAILIVEWYPC